MDLLPTTLTLAGASIVIAAALASATPFRPGVTSFDLGSGRLAMRTVTYLPRVPVRIQWSLAGFSPPPQQPIAFAQAPGGRLIALVEPGGAMVSDDGRTWRVSRFEGATVASPTAIAFSRSLGALVTEASGVWVSRDGGESWRVMRERGARVFDDVAVVGDKVVFTDDRGGLWVSDSTSSAFRTLCDSGTSSAVLLVSTPDGSIRTQGGDACNWRVDSSGAHADR